MSFDGGITVAVGRSTIEVGRRVGLRRDAKSPTALAIGEATDKFGALGAGEKVGTP